MPRRPAYVGEFIYHALNRGAARMKLFDTARDYIAVQELLFEGTAAVGIRLCGAQSTACSACASSSALALVKLLAARTPANQRLRWGMASRAAQWLDQYFERARRTSGIRKRSNRVSSGHTFRWRNLGRRNGKNHRRWIWASAAWSASEWVPRRKPLPTLFSWC